MIGLEPDPAVTRFNVSYGDAGVIQAVVIGIDLGDSAEDADVLVSFDLALDEESRVASVDTVEYRRSTADRSERSVPVHAVAAIPAAEEAIRSAFDEIYVEPPFCEWIEDCCDESAVPDFGPGEPASIDVAHTGGES